MRIFYSTRPSAHLLHLSRLAACFGITTDLVDVGSGLTLQHVLNGMGECELNGLVFDALSLDAACDQQVLDQIARFLKGRKVRLLILATHPHGSSIELLRTFTEGAVRGLRTLAAATRVSFPTQGNGLSRELSSQEYPRAGSPALVLDSDPDAGPVHMMELDGSPAFAHRHLGNAHVFVWSTLGVFDVDRPLEAESQFEEATDEYIPAIIFLREAFGDRCWHNPRAAAGMVIDDPLLTKNYGFIDFPRLLESARQHRYHITLAFIPWNHWRSDPVAVQMFRDYSDSFSICAHGCDHTKNEFGAVDYESLLLKCLVAQERMERHRRRTGLGSEPLMVCPQEQYSVEAMRAFADGRQFLGLVNTACVPRNLTTGQVRGADLLLPAQDCFFGFPVFKRHYWKDMSAFAMAAYLGKPAILVEHHEFFRDGPGPVETFVSKLAEIRPDIQWTPISETATKTHLRRQTGQGLREVRFFTDNFQLEHLSGGPTKYRLLRRIPETTFVQRVIVGESETPFSRTGEFLTFEVLADSPATIGIQVIVKALEPKTSHSPGMRYRTSVAVRRGLSEFRDNVISRNRFALKAGRSLMRLLKQTAG